MKEIKRQVPWTKTLVEDFIEEAMLSDDEAFILRTRVIGWSIIKQADELGVGTSTVSNLINSCKIKYDIVQKQFPDRFPKRKTSKEEELMDNLDKDLTIPKVCPSHCKVCKHKDLDKMSARDLLDCLNNCFDCK